MYIHLHGFTYIKQAMKMVDNSSSIFVKSTHKLIVTFKTAGILKALIPHKDI
jgi:hypothetical protein